MLIVMRKSATDEQIDRVLEVARGQGLTPVPIPGAQRTAVGLTGNQGAIDPLPFQELDGVQVMVGCCQLLSLRFWKYSRAK